MIFSVNVRPNIFMEQFIHNPPHGVQHYLWDMDSPHGEGTKNLFSGESERIRICFWPASTLAQRTDI
jgi:hypothetical protein